MLHIKFQGNWHIVVREKNENKAFSIYEHGGHLSDVSCKLLKVRPLLDRASSFTFGFQ